MIVIIVTFSIAEENAAKFEEVMGRLAAATRANEPGTTLYQLARSTKDPTCYRMLEIYADEAALAAHSASEHFRTISPEIGPLLADKPRFERHDAIG